MEKAKIIYIFKKLPIRDRVTVFIFTLALSLSAILMVSGFLFGKLDKREVFFPAPTMSDTDLYQKYTLKTYDNLPLAVSFRTIPFGMYVGGREEVTEDDGCSFSYNENSTIVVCEPLHAQDTPDIIRDRMYNYLFGRDAGTQSTYEEAVCGSGYMNGLYADYISGTYTVAGVERYLVGYRYYTGLEKDILFFVVTEDGTLLPACKRLLDQMYYTMFSFDPAEGDEAVLHGSYDSTKKDEGETAERLSERKRLMAELQEKVKQAAASDSVYTFDDSDLYVPVEVNNSYGTAVFFLTYTDINKKPEKMLLYAPDGMVYDEPVLDDLAGEISFWVGSPAQGEWVMVVSNEGGLGTYHAQVVEKGAYEALHSDNAYVEDRQGPPAD